MNLDWQKGNGILPAIIQHYQTKQVLMLGYMNEESLKITLKTNKVTFWSRSKNRLWQKGESSGNTLNFKSYDIDCDQDTLLIQVDPSGPTCHTGSWTCFGKSSKKLSFLYQLEATLKQRKKQLPEGSYTTQLYSKGINKIAQKVGEEAVETVIATLGENRERVINESSDLIYHLLVLLSAQDIELNEVIECLKSRQR